MRCFWALTLSATGGQEVSKPRCHIKISHHEIWTLGPIFTENFKKFENFLEFVPKFGIILGDYFVLNLALNGQKIRELGVKMPTIAIFIIFKTYNIKF